MLIDNLAKLSRTSRISFLAALVVIIGAAFYNRIVNPHVTYLVALERYDAAVSKAIELNKQIAKVAEIDKKKLKGMTEQFTHLRNALFTPKEAKEFFHDLQAIAVETNCAVYSLNFITAGAGSNKKADEENLGITAERVLLSVVGVYDDIIKLVGRLQERSGKVWIESLNMEIMDYGSPQIKCDVTIRIYTTQNKEAAFYE